MSKIKLEEIVGVDLMNEFNDNLSSYYKHGKVLRYIHDLKEEYREEKERYEMVCKFNGQIPNVKKMIIFKQRIKMCEIIFFNISQIFIGE